MGLKKVVGEVEGRHGVESTGHADGFEEGVELVEKSAAEIPVIAQSETEAPGYAVLVGTAGRQVGGKGVRVGRLLDVVELAGNRIAVVTAEIEVCREGGFADVDL